MPDNVHALPTAARNRQLDQLLPRLPSHHVPRQRLVQALVSSGSRLNLVCAPAGFGKSVLLNECARQAGLGTRVVWLDLVGQATSPATLLKRLALALGVKPDEDEPQVAINELLGSVEQPLWVIVDDYPRDPCAELDACMEHVLERTPHRVRWWIGGRRRPNWGVPRLLLQGDVQELDTRALTFNEQELSDWLTLRQLGFSDEQRQRLHRQSDGWLAALCLMLIEHSDTANDSLLEYPVLHEYVEREVLDSLPAPLRKTLLVLAHLPRFSIALFSQLMPDHDSRQIFQQLRQRQLVVPAEDGKGQWYRLWQALAFSIRQTVTPADSKHFHMQACRWFAAQGQVRDAIQHALRAGEPEVATSYLQRFSHDQLLRGRSVPQLLQWRAEVPAWLFSSSPRLIIMQAWALVIGTRLDEVKGCLAELQRFLPQPNAERHRELTAQYQTLLGTLHRNYGLRSARQHCQEALESLAETSWAPRVLCHQALAQQATAELDLARAHEHSREGLGLARSKGDVMLETLLSVDHIHQLGMMGELDAALQQAEAVLAKLRDFEPYGPIQSRLLLLRGTLLASSGNTAEARQVLQAGMKEAEECEDAYQLFGFLGLFQLALEEGNANQARQLLSQAEAQMRHYRAPVSHYREALQLAHAELRLLDGAVHEALGAFQAVRQHFENEEQLPPSGFYDIPLRARLGEARALLALGETETACGALEALLRQCRRTGHAALAVEVRLCRAEALWKAALTAEAAMEVATAISDAERQQLMQPLLAMQRRAPECMADALDELDCSTVWRQRLLEAIGLWQPPAKPGESPLSKREEAVLRLIARGSSNQQIADALFLSVHTVKTHARRINVKLGVERRTQAVAKAKSEGWI